MKKSQLRQLIKEEIESIIPISGAGAKYDYFDRMEGLSNMHDLPILKTKLRGLTTEWIREGFDKQDVKDYMNFLIDEI